MGFLQTSKVTALPAVLTPSTLYFVAASANSTDMEIFLSSSDGLSSRKIVSGVNGGGTPVTVLYEKVALSDMVTDLNTGLKACWRDPVIREIVSLNLSLETPSTSGPVTVQIKIDGVNLLSSVLTVDQDEESSHTSSLPYVMVDSILAAYSKVEVYVDTAGVNATGATLTVGYAV